MYMLSLSLRGGNDVGKHRQMNGRTNKSTMDPHKFEGPSILNILIYRYFEI